jgi:LysM repeat protein
LTLPVQLWYDGKNAGLFSWIVPAFTIWLIEGVLGMQGVAWRKIRVLTLLVIVMLIIAGCTRAKPPQVNLLPTPKVAAVAVGVQAGDGDPTPTVVVAPTQKTQDYPAPGEPEATATIPPTATATPTATPTTQSPETPPTSTPPPQEDIRYVVQRGDTLIALAERFNTSVEGIMLKNSLVDPNAIFVGQELIIPVDYIPEEPAGPRTVEHKVREGETLSFLARLYRTTVDAIRNENPSISDPQNLRVGMVLTITIGNEPPLRSHVVRAGESLFSIARRYGVDVQALVEFNGLVDPNRVFVGQRLFIPSA